MDEMEKSVSHSFNVKTRRGTEVEHNIMFLVLLSKGGRSGGVPSDVNKQVPWIQDAVKEPLY